MAEGERPIAAFWESYLSQVIPPEASESQRRETRRAFYAGAGAVFSVIVSGIDQSTEAFAQVMTEVSCEVEEYGFECETEAWSATHPPETTRASRSSEGGSST